MKTLLLAAAAALSIGIGSAYASDGDGYSATTLFTQLPGQQPSLASAPSPGNVAAADTATPIHTFVTRHDTGTWLFPPASGVGG
jgi:hypothetical protein